MTLFAALGEKSTAPTSTCSPPTAIQLHSHHALDFIANKVTHESSGAHTVTNKYQHSLLSYQAIQTQQEEEERIHNNPDLGVWNCSLNNEFDTNALGDILQNVVLHSGHDADAPGENKENEETAESATKDISTNTALMTIHLEELTDVQPTLERMRSVITNAFENVPTKHGGSTSIKTLQSCTFGTSQIKQEVNPNSVPGGKISLILAVIVPTVKERGNASTEYQERQKQLLVVYHLHKFALEVNCTLCFVREGEKAEGETMNTVTIEELAGVVRRVALGQAPVEDAVLGESSEDARESSEGVDNEAPAAAEPAIYPPGSHDAELICGAMQRNASCEGLWDASKDDLDKALPPSSKKLSGESETQEAKGGDQEWLEKLASSVGITVDTTTKESPAVAADESKPVEKKKEVKKKKSTKSASSKSEKAPSDFFANLLKK